MDDLAGQQLGNYQLLSLLGQGAFASVYLGKHIYLGTKAAVKVLHVQIEKSTHEHFLTEARTVAHLEHPHIVRVLDFGIEHEVPFLVMSYLSGGTLRHRHPKGTPLPLDTIVSYIQHIALALQYAHHAKIIHRDIKPENMLLDGQNNVLLSDFGIALTLPQTGSLHTQAMAGTAPYMAPEQIMGKPRAASDQYALGIVVYEWLCGTRPFSGNEWSIAYQHIHTSPPSLHEKMPTVPSAVEAVVFKALAKEWMQRFASVQDFAIAFKQACQGSEDQPTTPSLRETSTSIITHQLNQSSIYPNNASLSQQDSIPGTILQNTTHIVPPTDQSQQSTSIIYPHVSSQQPPFVSTPRLIPPKFQQFPEYASSENVLKKRLPTTGRNIVLTFLLLLLISSGVIRVSAKRRRGRM